MRSDALANLAKIHKLKTEPAHRNEFDGLLRSALDRATDAKNPGLTLASRFTLAYDASHAWVWLHCARTATAVKTAIRCSSA